MSLHGELREVIFGEDQEMRMVWLQQRGLIASQKTCRKCDSDMRFGAKCNVTDGFVWPASAKVVKQLFLPETARSSRSRNRPFQLSSKLTHFRPHDC